MLIRPHTYPYAIDDDGKPIYIDYVTKENRRQSHYHCYGCGAELFPVLGDVREHHFRHEKDAICDPDKYLHEFAKAAIKQRFDESDKFIVQYNARQICKQAKGCQFYSQFLWDECEQKGLYAINLKEYYDTCLLEKGYYQDLPNGKKKYIADLFLSNSQKPNQPPICIEIWVTHECTEDKKINGGRIIEIKIQKEEDVKRPIIESDDEMYPVRFYNFQREIPIETSKTFKHIKLLPGLHGKVIVTDESTCKDELEFDPKATHEIILHESVQQEVQEVAYAYFCNENGVTLPEQGFCEHGNIIKSNGQAHLKCNYFYRERKCPCSLFKYSPDKGAKVNNLQLLYWTKDSEITNTHQDNEAN